MAATGPEEHLLGIEYSAYVARFAVLDLEFGILFLFFFHHFFFQELLQVGLSRIHPGRVPDAADPHDGAAHAALDHAREHLVIRCAKSFGIGLDQGIVAILEAVFLVTGHGFREFLLETDRS